MGRICTPNRFEYIEQELKKILPLEDLAESTAERLHSFATKEDIEKLINSQREFVKNYDFGNFVHEYNEYKSQMINAHELQILQEDIKILQKNASTFISKNEFFN